MIYEGGYGVPRNFTEASSGTTAPPRAATGRRSSPSA